MFRKDTMTPKDLEKILDLKYLYVLNGAKVFKIICAVLSLNFGIILSATGITPTHRILGIACLTFFIWLEVGSPYDKVLTEESLGKIRTWLDKVDNE
jgi:hypothetical protein